MASEPQIRCTFCGAFMSAKPTFDGIIPHAIPIEWGVDENGDCTYKGEIVHEERVTLWTCKRCGRDNDPDELIPMPDDGYEDTGGY